MKKYILIRPAGQRENARLEALLSELPLPWEETEIWTCAAQMHPCPGAKLLFFLDLGETGVNLRWLEMLDVIRRMPHLFDGCAGAVWADGDSELYTKSAGRELVLAANMAGCVFPGRPLAEGTGSLRNFAVAAKNAGTGFLEAYRAESRDLFLRLRHFEAPRHRRPKLLVLHASIWETSNTMMLWEMVKESLADVMEICEISLRNGEVYDCVGCPYTMCMHFSERGKCYYGGVIVEQVYPAVEACDAILMLCPNYNDALSANLSAFINRLTSLYRKRQFYEKYLYAIIVSGYSGGDILAGQLISGLNMNKTFILPPRFALFATANDPGSIGDVPGIREQAKSFGEAMLRQLTAQEDGC